MTEEERRRRMAIIVEQERARAQAGAMTDEQRAAQAMPVQERVAAALERGAPMDPQRLAQTEARARQEAGLTFYDSPREAMAAQMQPGGVQAFLTGATQGASFGGADELIGGIGGITGQGYEQTSDAARAMLDAARRDRPITTGVGEVLGGTATALTYGLPALAGRGLAGAAAAGAGVGAAEGGVYGFLSGEGSAAERAGQAMPYAGLGAIAGAAAPVVMRGAEAITRPIRGTVGNITDRLLNRGSDARAQRMLATSVQRSGVDPTEIADRLTRSAREGQPEYRLMDAMGLEGRRRASGVVRVGGEGSTELADFLAQRQVNQGDRIASFLSDAFDGAQTAAQRQAAVREARDMAADQAYSLARQNAGPVNLTPAIDTIDDLLGRNPILGETALTRSEIGSRLMRLRSQMQSGGEQLIDFNSVLQVKQDLGRQIERLRRAGDTPPMEMSRVFGALDQALEAASPDYRAANDAFREASRVIDAFEQGQRMASPSLRAEDVADQVGRMTPEQVGAARVGFGDRAMARLEATAGEGTNRARPFTSTRFQEIARALADDPDLLSRRVNREQEMFETMRRATGGSMTADNQRDIAETMAQNSGVLRNIFALRLPTAWGQIVDSAVGDFGSGLSPQTARLVSDALMSNDMRALQAITRRQGVTDAQQAVIEALARVGATQQAGSF